MSIIKNTVVENAMKKYNIDRGQATKRVNKMLQKTLSSNKTITKKIIDKILSTPI